MRRGGRGEWVSSSAVAMLATGSTGMRGVESGDTGEGERD